MAEVDENEEIQDVTSEDEDGFGALEFDFDEDLTPPEDDKDEDNDDNQNDDDNQDDDNQDDDNPDNQDDNDDSSSDDKGDNTDKDKPKGDDSDSDDDEDITVLSDDQIREKYDKDVTPALVRHYEEVKQHLIVNDDFEFNGHNIEEAYEQDAVNRQKATAEKIVASLPDNYKKILGHAIADTENDLKPETLDEILKIETESLKDTFDPNDDESMRAYVKGKLIEQGEDADIAEDRVDIYEEKGKLKATAEKLKKASDTAREAQIEAKKEADNQAAAAKKQKDKALLDGVTTTLTKSKMSKKKQGELAKFIFGKTDTGRTRFVSTLNQIWNNPEALVDLADILSTYDSKKGTFSIPRLKKMVETEATNTLKSNLAKRLSGAGAFTQENQSKKDGVVDVDNFEI